jgi:hypothetical protein
MHPTRQWPQLATAGMSWKLQATAGRCGEQAAIRPGFSTGKNNLQLTALTRGTKLFDNGAWGLGEESESASGR